MLRSMLFGEFPRLSVAIGESGVMTKEGNMIGEWKVVY